MELIKNKIHHFVPIMEKDIVLEQTAEMIVPDSYPDIVKIIDASGLACLKEKELHSDGLRLGGMVKAALLYLPEGEGSLRKIDVNIPFLHTAEGELTGTCVCTARITAADARMINPRKVQVSVTLLLEVKVFAPDAIEVSEDVMGECEVLHSTAEAYLLTGITEKAMVVTEELEISESRPAAEEILKADVRFISGEMKAIGAKAVFKGVACVRLLYSAAGEPYAVEQEFPFSQIMELEGLEEGASLRAFIQLAGLEMDFLTGVEARKLGLTLYVDVSLLCYMEKHVETVCDLYSTQLSLTPEKTPLSLQALQERIVRRQTLREILEVGEDVARVIDVTIWPGAITEQEGQAACECTAKLVYQTESGQTMGLTRMLRVVSPVESGTGQLTAELLGDITATPVSSGLELRLAMDFECVSLAERRLYSVTGLTQDDLPDRDPNAPNVILYRCKPEEGLWDIAKRYGSTRRRLALCNKLENEEQAPEGQVLLIPRIRG